MCWKDVLGQGFLTRCRHLFCTFGLRVFCAGLGNAISSMEAAGLHGRNRQCISSTSAPLLTLALLLDSLRCIFGFVCTSPWYPIAFSAAISVLVVGRLGVWTPATREDCDVPFVLPGAPQKWGPCCSRRGGRRHDPVPGFLVLWAWTGRARGHPEARSSILGRATEGRLAARSRTLYVHNDTGLVVPWFYRGRLHNSSLAARLLRAAAVH